MATLYTQQGRNQRRTWFLMMMFFGLVVGIGWFLSYYFDDVSILYIAVLFSIGMNVGAYWFSDKLVLSMHHAKKVTRDEMPDLWNITENLAITAGLPMPSLYVIDDPAPNAFATGRNPEHSVVAVTTGLLRILEQNELEGVIAHELSHIGNRDMLVGTVAVVLAGFVSIVADIFLRSSFRGRSDSGKGGGALVLIGIVLMILAPLFATLLRLALSRKREYLADASGALLTRYPEGLANALRKISSHGTSLQTARDATAHLFIANPFGSTKKHLSALFSTHPPVEKRVKALLGS